MIEYALKAKCVAMCGTMNSREIYEQVFLPEHQGMAYETFRAKLKSWRKRQFADPATMESGTYPNFTAHSATVQVDKEGRITQAWIKQQQDTLDWIAIKNFICDGAKVCDIQPTKVTGERMLEIPLFDMHFGVADLAYYKETLSDLLGIISEKQYNEINILFGQDVLHNNDMRGQTAKGTPIQRVDFVKAWEDCWTFFCAVIDTALQHSPRVCLRYTKGNHDECSAWCMFKALQAIYPQCWCDDSLAPRKCIYWNGCFIGFGHCEYTNKNSLLFQNFVLDFPNEFAGAKVREIHSGHLHRESIDEGMMVRRLPSGVPTDEWSSNNGYVGVHKRFQIFEWAAERLWGAYYV